jgi:methylmalonyl-CoA mutase
LGPKKAHGARAQFTTQLLATGGVITVGQGPFDAGTVGPNFKESGALVAVIASSDAIYAHEVVPIAQALKASGAQVVLVAGRPGEHEDAWREAGVDSFLFLGCDVAELLDRLYAFIGAHS